MDKMDYVLQMLDLTGIQGMVVMLTAFLVGFSKTGVSGVLMLVIPVLATVFGGKDSTGVLLPLLLVGDIFAVWSYRRSIDWKKVLAPLPWALIGLFLGAVVGRVIADQVFVILIGTIILFCLGILVYTEKMGKNFTVPTGTWFYITAGPVRFSASIYWPWDYTRMILWGPMPCSFSLLILSRCPFRYLPGIIWSCSPSYWQG